MTETYVEIIDVITTNTTQQQPQYTPHPPRIFIRRLCDNSSSISSRNIQGIEDRLGYIY